MRGRLRLAGVAVCLLVLAGLILAVAQPGLVPGLSPLELVIGAWVAFIGAAWLARRAPVKPVVWLILAGSIVMQVAALTGPPRNSDDIYRYIWDGRVQAAGIDPYTYAPPDARLAYLRNGFLWSPSTTATPAYGYCVPASTDPYNPAGNQVSGCTRINRPTVPTIYPPVAEGYFTAVHLLAPGDDSTTPLQAAAGATAVGTTILLLFGLRRKGRDPRLAALWAWCPTVALEAGQNGHVDIVGVALTAAALLLLASARSRERKLAGGALLGLAIATKVSPVLAMPGVLRRGWQMICAGAVSAIAIVYLPHLLAAASRVFGFLPGYLNQEGYSSGTGFSLVGLVASGPARTVIVLVILAAVAIAILRFGDPARPWRGGVLMTAAALAACTPRYQWYALLLVMLVALDGSPEWLAIAAGGYLSSYLSAVDAFGITVSNPRVTGYGAGVVIAGALALIRLRRNRRLRLTKETDTEKTPVLTASLPEAN